MIQDTTPEDGPALSTLLRQRMTERGLSQVDAAAELEVDNSRVNRWLRGDPPSDRKAPALARFLGLSTAEVVHLIYRARNEPKVDALAVATDLAERVATLEAQVAELMADRKPARPRKAATRR